MERETLDMIEERSLRGREFGLPTKRHGPPYPWRTETGHKTYRFTDSKTLGFRFCFERNERRQEKMKVPSHLLDKLPLFTVFLLPPTMYFMVPLYTQSYVLGSFVLCFRTHYPPYLYIKTKTLHTHISYIYNGVCVYAYTILIV